MIVQAFASETVAALAALVILLATLSVLLAALGFRNGTERHSHRKRRQRHCLKDGAEWIERLVVSVEEVNRFLKVRQRTSTGRASPEWLRGRRNRLTASRFFKAAAAVSEGMGVSKSDAYLCRTQVIEDMLTEPEAHRSPHRFGIANEARARQSYVGYRLHDMHRDARERFKVEEVGVCIWREEPWLAASPDGVIYENNEIGALEIKCCQKASGMYNVDNLPPEFYDQIQGEMAILGCALQANVSWCDLFVWSPHRRVCRRIYFDRDYFHSHLLPKLRTFYFNCYVPVARSMLVGASGCQVKQSIRRLVKQHQDNALLALAKL